MSISILSILIITFIIKIQRQYTFMNSCGIQFKKFKSEVNFKPIKVRSQFEKVYDGAYHANKTKENIPLISPQKQPTSFRQLSGSRDKNKIFSGKKNALQNKLNTLRSNEKNTIFDISSEDKFQATEFDSGKKEGLFTRLLTSRSPNHGKKNLFADESNGSVNTTNDSNGISFSAFRGINLGENENYANLVLQKKSQSDQQDKGLKFRAFPHKKPSIGQKQKNLPLSILAQGPLISQKGGSRSKSKKNEKIKQERSPIKQTIRKWTPSCIGQRDKQGNVGLRRVSTLQQFRENQYGLRLDSKMVKKSIQCSNSKQNADEVIRSREGSMAFDMSPTLF